MRILAIIISLIVAATPLPIDKKEQTTETATAQINNAKTAEKPKSSTPKQTPTPPLPAATPQPQPVPQQPKSNETIAWEFLISQGYSRVQVAGIMGNLRQEHSFQTSDVPGGLGIAQWLGNRRDNLMARPNYLDINVQLQFLIDELNSGEAVAKQHLLTSTTVEEAVLAFSHKFERCGDCRDNQRIQYAYDILARY